MGWFSSDDDSNNEKQNAKILSWAWKKLQEKKKRDAERKAQEQKQAEEAVRKALEEKEDA